VGNELKHKKLVLVMKNGHEETVELEQCGTSTAYGINESLFFLLHASVKKKCN